MEAIGVIDIGKTHARLAIVEAASGTVLETQQRRCTPHAATPLRQLDVQSIEAWLLQALRNSPVAGRIQTLVPIAHGAAAVLLDRHGVAVAAPDYEDPEFERVAASYHPLRDPFPATYSPFLPLGLNLGRQLHYLATQCPDAWARVNLMLPYPQYWAWRFSGIAATELTSLGCHSDLWRPAEQRYSDLALRAGWEALLPPLSRADATLGTVSSAFAAATGLDPRCRVLCGIHDSNASWLCHRSERAGAFALVSSGTWTVIMAHGTPLASLCEGQDMLANVDAWGSPTPTARFMGGREFAAIAGESGAGLAPGHAEVAALIDRGTFALPSFAVAGGSPPRQPGIILRGAGLDPVGRTALATLYVALMTDLLLDRLAVSSVVLVDGPLARNALYCSLLATLRAPDRVARSTAPAEAADAARHLAGFAPRGVVHTEAIAPGADDRLAAYREQWRSLVQSAA